MKRIVNMWSDRDGCLGIIELEDDAFGTCFHPIQITSSNKKHFTIIHNLWYTTYNGARQFFRLKTNDYWISGRLSKVIESEYIDDPDLNTNLQRKTM